MSPKSELTEETLNELLSWLDPDPDKAALKYPTLHQGLTKVIRHWGCSEAEDLADETINRVARKVGEIRKEYKGNPERYFYGVAKKLWQEYQRRPQQQPRSVDELRSIPSLAPADELPHECLEKCLQKLKPDQREIVRLYYRDHTPRQRDELAKHLGTVVNTLRVRVFRTVEDLRKCVNKCIERGHE
jgi:RNA polymerase sigma factor (sigma-70 family)